MRLLIAALAASLVIVMIAACGGAPEPGDENPMVRTLTADEYYEKVHGGWLGSVVAGALGMSVQGMHRRDLKPFLMEMGQWPLTSYIKTAPPQRRRGGVAHTVDEWGSARFRPGR